VAPVSARDREGAAQALRSHFVSDRLSLEEFGDRVRLALDARDGSELRRALRGLPPVWRDGDELRRVALTVRRGVVRAGITLLWFLLTVVLLIAFAASVVAHGPSTSDEVVFPVAWLIVSALAWRAYRRA
jgi:hypothetical protein